MKKKAKKYVFGVFLSSILLSGCGGGGGGSSSKPSPGPGPGNAVNGQFSGQVFIGGEDEGWSLDLESGSYTRIQGVDWEGQSGNYPSIADFSAYPIAYNGAEILAKIENCQRSASRPSRYDDCLVRYSNSGEQLASPSGSIFQDIVGKPKLSRDGQYIAFFYDEWGSSSPAELSLIITDLNLSIISAAPVLVSGSYTVSSPSLTWLPDNRLVYTFDESIYLADAPLDATSTVLATFAVAEGEPRQITASPDGNQLAFILLTDSSFRTATATPWVIDTNGTNRQGLRQLARVDDDLRPSFRFPTWSPDGTQILVTHGRVAAANNIDLGLQGGGYIIPAASNALVLDDDDPSIHRVRSFFGTTSGLANPELTTNFDIDDGPIAWLPN